jgi:hypothetical protein
MASVPTMVVEIHVPLLPTPDLSDLEDHEEFGPGRRVALPLSAP